MAQTYSHGPYVSRTSCKFLQISMGRRYITTPSSISALNCPASLFFSSCKELKALQGTWHSFLGVDNSGKLTHPHLEKFFWCSFVVLFSEMLGSVPFSTQRVPTLGFAFTILWGLVRNFVIILLYSQVSYLAFILVTPVATGFSLYTGNRGANQCSSQGDRKPCLVGCWLCLSLLLHPSHFLPFWLKLRQINQWPPSGRQFWWVCSDSSSRSFEK